MSFASCLDVAAISLDMGEALDTNRELATVGICNCKLIRTVWQHTFRACHSLIKCSSLTYPSNCVMRSHVRHYIRVHWVVHFLTNHLYLSHWSTLTMDRFFHYVCVPLRRLLAIKRATNGTSLFLWSDAYLYWLRSSI